MCLPEHKVCDGLAGGAEALDDDDEGGQDGAPEHLVVGGGFPQVGQVVDQTLADVADAHRHTLNQVRQHVQHSQLETVDCVSSTDTQKRPYFQTQKKVCNPSL